jgi:hypothetical protein
VSALTVLAIRESESNIMSEKKPTPIITPTSSKKCPVCGQRSYSPGGIHPQCAVAQADAPRKLRLAAQKKAMAQAKADTFRTALAQKLCPKCASRLPAQQRDCACGHRFDVSENA